MHQKIRFPYWLIIILLAAFAVGYFAWSESLKQESGIMNYGSPSTPSASGGLRSGNKLSPELVEGWKIYRNEEYGFEVMYPENWLFAEGQAANKLQLLNANFYDKRPPGTGNFIVSVYSNTSILKLDDWVMKYINPRTPTGESLISSREESSILKEQALKLTIFAFDSSVTEFFIQRNDNIYAISFDEQNPNDPYFEEHKTIYSQILSTFKFVE